MAIAGGKAIIACAITACCALLCMLVLYHLVPHQALGHRNHKLTEGSCLHSIVRHTHRSLSSKHSRCIQETRQTLRRTMPRQSACRTPRCRNRKLLLGRDTRCTPREKEEQGEAQGARDDADLGKISGDAIGNVGH